MGDYIPYLRQGVALLPTQRPDRKSLLLHVAQRRELSVGIHIRMRATLRRQMCGESLTRRHCIAQVVAVASRIWSALLHAQGLGIHVLPLPSVLEPERGQPPDPVDLEALYNAEGAEAILPPEVRRT